MSFQNLFISCDCKTGAKSYQKRHGSGDVCEVLLQWSSAVLLPMKRGMHFTSAKIRYHHGNISVQK